MGHGELSCFVLCHYQQFIRNLVKNLDKTRQTRNRGETMRVSRLDDSGIAKPEVLGPRKKLVDHFYSLRWYFSRLVFSQALIVRAHWRPSPWSRMVQRNEIEKATLVAMTPARGQGHRDARVRIRLERTGQQITPRAANVELRKSP